MLTKAALSNPLLPTRHWEPRCECCRLRHSHPDDFKWLAGALQGDDDCYLTQEQIAAELSRRTGLGITQSQISNHKTRHHDPTIGALAESYVGHMAQLEAMAGMPPAEMAVGFAKLALLKTAEYLDVENLEPKDAASVASAVRGLASVLLGSDEAEARALLAQHDAHAAEVRASLEDGTYEEAAAKWVETNYPELANLVSDPDKLRRVMAVIAPDEAAKEAASVASGASNGPAPTGPAPNPEASP